MLIIIGKFKTHLRRELYDLSSDIMKSTVNCLEFSVLIEEQANFLEIIYSSFSHAYLFVLGARHVASCFPDQGSNSRLLHWEHGIPTTRLPGHSNIYITQVIQWLNFPIYILFFFWKVQPLNDLSDVEL